MATTMDGYIRVSRTNGREGDSYISPTVQREAIEHWAKANGIKLGTVRTEENTSGGKAVADRALEELVRRCESGASAGIIVYRLNRFARSQKETHVAAYRIKEAGTRLVGVADGVDTAAPGGQYVLAFMAIEAEKYLEDTKQNWRAATEKAVGRGVHVACRAPVGYIRRDEVDPEYDSRGHKIPDGRLLVDEAVAPHVRRAFELRAEGASYRQIGRYLDEHGVRPSIAAKRGWVKWSANGVLGLLKNRAYLGEARGAGGAVNKNAHDAIVAPELFVVVQGRSGRDKFHGRNGSLSADALLPGIVRCAGCGHTLRVTGSTNRSTGQREASYTCAKEFASGDCTAPASARVKLVDGYVLFVLQQPEVAKAIAAAGASAEARWLEAKQAVEQAEAELDKWVLDPGLRAKIGDAKFEQGISVRAEALDAARRRLWELDDPGLPADAELVYVNGEPSVYEKWDELPIARKRQLLRGMIASVTVAKADPARRRWQPVSERIDVRFLGQPA